LNKLTASHELCTFVVPVIITLTNSMEQSHSAGDNSHSANQEISRFSWNPKVHYRVHNSMPIPRSLTFCNKLEFYGED